jgi:MFS family permease
MRRRHQSLTLNVVRGVQGVGGAFLLTASLTILSNVFEGAERSPAFAFWGASLGVALAVGPIIGGLGPRLSSWFRCLFLHA